MQYTSFYESPLGDILLAADDVGLTGLWFEREKYYAHNLAPEHEEKEIPLFAGVKCWLDIYFSGQEPDFMPPIHLTGTPFQMEVWNILRSIPYGTTTTYGEIARTLALRSPEKGMSAQAVGDAVGHNEISIIVPCHRVVGSDNSLTGYAGGIYKKIALLKLEGGWRDEFFIPKETTAP